MRLIKKIDANYEKADVSGLMSSTDVQDLL
jgi:hypothetical protein